ncbi:MAG: HlyD family efflux transporter periplasmic adaptor subunit [Planctomycetes bacterium]|nr:HlyD family efflux transporter periplasmic adaptor subunit [Planctomycetota bacterium]
MTADVEVKAFQARLTALESEVARLNESVADTREYFQVFLEKTISVLGVGGGIWQIGQYDELTCASHINLASAELEESGRQHQLLDAAVEKVIQTSGSVVLTGRGSANLFDEGVTEEIGENESPHTLLFTPIFAANKLSAILLIISPQDVDPRAVRGFLGFLLGLCELATRYLERNQIDHLQDQLSRADRLRQYVSALHSSLHPQRTCYALANYGQELLGVYRCMAGTFSSNGKFRMEAVSGLESVAVKSSLIKGISAVARQVCRNDKALLVDNPEAARSKNGYSDEDELMTAARLYMLQARSVIIGVFPIKLESNVVGALIVEKAVDEPINQSQRQQIEALTAEAGSALQNSLAHRQIPFSPLVRAVAHVRDRIYRTTASRRIAIASLIALLVLLPFWIPMQIKVYGSAELMPVSSRTAYASQDGIIDQVSIPEDRLVEAGAVLAMLDTKIIDSMIERATNELGEINIVLNQEIDANPTGTNVKIYRSQIQAKQAELEQYQQEKKRFQIVAPVAGRIITPESTLEQLLSLPVSRGEPILEVVPEDTPWILKVSVPEDEAGELLKAYDDPAEGKPLEAKFILNAFPSYTFDSKVISVARKAYVQTTGQEKYRNVIEVRLEQPPDLTDNFDPRQGLEGKAAIDCGPSNLFYAVTHEFANFIRINLF